MKKFLLFIFFVATAFNYLKAQLAPKYSNEFLTIGVGARAAGMANSMVASVDDVTSGYWNPAGLVEIKDNIQISLMHNEQFAGIGKNDYDWIERNFTGNIGDIRFFTTALTETQITYIYNKLKQMKRLELNFKIILVFDLLKIMLN